MNFRSRLDIPQALTGASHARLCGRHNRGAESLAHGGMCRRCNGQNRWIAMTPAAVAEATGAAAPGAESLGAASLGAASPGAAS